MDIVIAAEKPSIAKLFSEYLKRRIEARQIRVRENPDETGSFYIGFEFDQYRMSPNGEIELDRLELLDQA